MINKYDIAKALLDKAIEVSATNSYKLVREGQKYKPNPSKDYVVESVIYGDDNAIGMADNSSDIQFGVYQLSIHTPKSSSGAKWTGLEVLGVYQAGFARGVQLTHNGQMLRIRDSNSRVMLETNTHYVHILSIEFSVIN